MTKFVDSCNIDYINEKILDLLPEQSHNLLFYGSVESKLYSYAIKYVQQQSPSQLTYEKKMTVSFNNDEYIYRISDVHIEINFEFLGCIAKNLWAAIYHNIEQLAGNRKFIVLCRNFCSVNNELIDNFYTYMNQSKSTINFIFLVNNISCLPKELVDSCNIIPLKRISNSKLKIESVKTDFVNNVFSFIKNRKTFTIKALRGILYDILIYQIDIYDFFYNLMKKISQELKPSQEKMFKLLNEINNILKLFNNNYRSIYHLENMVLSIITILYD
jgi:hypothetical protein